MPDGLGGDDPQEPPGRLEQVPVVGEVLQSERRQQAGDVEGDEQDHDGEAEEELVLADPLLLEKGMENIKYFSLESVFGSKEPKYSILY